MESKGFEESFKNAFDGAEVSPSVNVWTNIELDLEKTSGGKMKRNLLMFQLLAAASFVFALGIGGLYYLNNQPIDTEAFANEVNPKSQVEQKQDPDNKNGTAKNQKAVDLNSSVEQSNVPASRLADAPQSAKQTTTIKKSAVEIAQSAKATQANDEITLKSGMVVQSRHVAKTELTALAQARKPVLILPEAEEPVVADPAMIMLAKLKDREKQLQQEEENKNKSDERMWTSIGFGAGSYKPKVSPAAANLGVASKPDDVSGSSYSASINVGGKISKRFIVQGGISYLTSNADFTSTVTRAGLATTSDLYNAGNFADFETTNPYTVNSNLQFVSIPVQAGYLILDRDFAIQLNGGVATDLFISNTLTAENTSYQKVKQSAGSDSPYRTVNFSGLLGTEFSYRIANRYRVSLNPGLRYSINSIYKSDVAAEIAPVTYDVSLRFRYIFK